MATAMFYEAEGQWPKALKGSPMFVVADADAVKNRMLEDFPGVVEDSGKSGTVVVVNREKDFRALSDWLAARHCGCSYYDGRLGINPITIQVL